jgi:hypothetical protein
MAAKLKLCADPTFQAPVPIPVPGAGTTPVQFTFKHRTREQVMSWLNEDKDKGDVETVRAVASGWDLDDAFTDENIATLCSNYAGAGFAIVQTYLDELRGARAKN